MSRYRFRIYPDRCSGCMRCMLACSRQYTRQFNPEKAFLRVFLSSTAAEIVFLDECNQCGLCADSCFFEAIMKTDREAEA